MADKVRHVDFRPDEYIAGVAGVLSAAEQGIFWLTCSLIMSEGGAIDFNPRRIGALCLMPHKQVLKIILKLVEMGKLDVTNEGKITQKRAISEVISAENRIEIARENGKKGGRPGGKTQSNQQNAKATVSFSEKLTTNHQPPTINQEDNPTTPRGASDEFEAWWRLYPRKESKRAAQQTFNRIRKEVNFETLEHGVARYAEFCRAEGTAQRFIKQPTTWLNGGCWADELQANGAGKPTGSPGGSRGDALAAAFAEVGEQAVQGLRSAGMESRGNAGGFADGGIVIDGDAGAVEPGHRGAGDRGVDSPDGPTEGHRPQNHGDCVPETVSRVPGRRGDLRPSGMAQPIEVVPGMGGTEGHAGIPHPRPKIEAASGTQRHERMIG
jgi:hypothetical protein